MMFEYSYYKPPWYPFDNNPWQIVSIMSNNVETNYSKWMKSLAPGELDRLVKQHREEQDFFG